MALDGRFTPEQERDGIEMNDSDKVLITTAISALPTLVQYAIELGWHNAHKLAQLAVPEQTISGENINGELDWWSAHHYGYRRESCCQTYSGN